MALLKNKPIYITINELQAKPASQSKIRATNRHLYLKDKKNILFINSFTFKK